MLILKLIMISLGIVFIVFGYSIYFKKKYHLINNFKEDYKLGIKTEAYARRVGFIELIAGILFLIIGILLMVLV